MIRTSREAQSRAMRSLGLKWKAEKDIFPVIGPLDRPHLRINSFVSVAVI